MNTKVTAAQPPLFSETHAITIAAAARDHPDADGLLVEIPSQSALVAASSVDSVIVRWIVESPVSVDEMGERHAQLEQAGLKYVCLSMRTDKLVPLAAKGTH